MTRDVSILLLLTIILISCRDSPSKGVSSSKTSSPLNLENDKEGLGYISQIDDVGKLITLLNDSSDLEDEHIGFTGMASTSYAYFKRLTEIAADTTLLRLTYLANPKLRIYGMWALTTKDKKLALEQVNRIKNDKTSVIYFSGCTKIPLPLCYLALTRFDSADVKIKFKSSNGYLDIEVA